MSSVPTPAQQPSQQQDQDGAEFTKPPQWQSDDKVEIPVQDFLEFVQSYKELDFRAMPKPPTNFFIQKLKLNGKTTKESRVMFDCNFEVLVLVDAWTKCDLLDSSITIHDYKIIYNANNGESKGNNSAASQPAPQQQQAVQQQPKKQDDSKNARSAKKQRGASKKDDEDLPSPVASAAPSLILEPQVDAASQQQIDDNNGGHIGVIGSTHSLVATRKGLYTISLTISVPYLSKEQKGCALAFPTYSLQNNLTFEVVNQNVRIEVKPALETRLLPRRQKEPSTPLTPSNNNSSRRGNKKPHEEVIAAAVPELDESTVIESVFPPTHYLDIHWTVIEKKEIKQEDKNKPKQPSEEKQREQRPLNVTVEQYTLHSIGGGVISSAAEFNYTITNGSVNVLYILIANEEVDRKIRVLRVDGANIKNWEFKKYKVGALSGDSKGGSVSESSFAQIIQQQQQPRGANSSSNNENDKKQNYFIKVILDCGMDSFYNLKIFAEMEMQSQSAQIQVPNFSCISVNREKGNLAIEATGNIEISELASRQLTKIDVRELPGTLSNRASNPILLAYKFLQTQNTFLKLDIKKHDDVAVLVAVIEEALYRVTYSEGFLLYQTMLKVRNTTQDFIKITLPRDGMLWSTASEGRPVRPAKDKQGRVLLPLKRSSSESVFKVEIFFLIKVFEKMQGTGKISMSFPTFNTPINYSYFQVYLPQGFTYGEFEGDLRERKEKYWTSTPTVLSLQAAPQDLPSYSQQPLKQQLRNARNAIIPQMQQMQMQQQMQQQMPQQMAMNAIYNAMPQPQMAAPMNLSNANDSDSDDDENEDEDDDEDNLNAITGVAAAATPMGGETLSSSVIGVMPVTLNALEVGTPFYFERGVSLGAGGKSSVEQEAADVPLQISVEFKEVKKSWWDKRSLFPWRTLVWSIVLGFCLFLFIFLFRFLTQ